MMYTEIFFGNVDCFIQRLPELICPKLGDDKKIPETSKKLGYPLTRV